MVSLVLGALLISQTPATKPQTTEISLTFQQKRC